MKIVLLADLHGNMVATKAMEQELDRIRPDEVYFLGDAIGKPGRMVVGITDPKLAERVVQLSQEN